MTRPLTVSPPKREIVRRPVVGVEGGDRAGVLVAVHHPVVVAVAVARVVAGEELGAVAQVVAILVAIGLVDAGREVVPLLPAVRDAVVIAVLGRGCPRQGEQREGAEHGDRANR